MFWWLIAVLTAASCVWANITLHEGYSWIAGGLGLVSFLALCVDVGVRRRVDRATRAALASAAADGAERQGASQVDVTARTVAAGPMYVATLTLLITLTALASVFGALVVTGFNAGYETLIVDRAEGEPIQEFAGLDLVEGGGDICEGGQDYWACVAMHNTMWNSLCTGGWGQDHTPRAQSTCSSLRTFVDNGWAKYRTCGYGCETGGGDGAGWGWSNMRPNPLTNSVAQPAVTHSEECYFVLGEIEIGHCPRS